jgi:hypothetical protein
MLATALALLRSPLGKIAAAFVGLAVVYGAGYYRGASKAGAACDAAAARAELATVKRDLSIAKSAQESADRIAADLSSQARSLAEKVTAYEEAIKSAEAGNPAGCALTGDDLRRLQSIR